ncbi:carboxypeptidase inhibitor SmCI-like [Ixodes scapularis]|uniref:carboxypeptidase inhibitor SmCI-like n=1 Tax=Ixodes scapularis TaxID=6945 RepID=UPI001A9E49D3|nr:carboxypeptidase inhibitor SmCI-like [Ixodes scapularis]
MEKVFRCLHLAVAVAVFTESFGYNEDLDDVCNAARPKPGYCSGRTRKYTFNIYLKQCQPVYVCGSSGTKNTFDTKQQCQQTCPIDQFCTIGRASTWCSADAKIITTWYLLHLTNKCVYTTGCAFMAADFRTKRECQAACRKHTVCYQPSNEGEPPKRARSVWHFSPEDQRCIRTTNSERNGSTFRPAYYDRSGNNFKSEKECMETCPYGGHLEECRLPKNEGTDCPEKSKPSFRYYYDAKSGTCSRFWYKGCDKNANNYLTKRACEATCQVLR